MKRKIILTACFLIFIIFLMILFSPFKYDIEAKKQQVKTTIRINAPVQKVFNYLGNSANASKWSTFVNHISPLNTAIVADGQIGSIRRCFKNKNEKGIVWDEKILERNQNVQRKISIFNAHGFPIISKGLATEQLYTAIDSNTTSLSFTLFFNTAAINWWDIFKMHFANYTVAYIYKNNLKNIKKYNEQ